MFCKISSSWRLQVKTIFFFLHGSQTILLFLQNHKRAGGFNVLFLARCGAAQAIQIAQREHPELLIAQIMSSFSLQKKSCRLFFSERSCTDCVSILYIVLVI